MDQFHSDILKHWDNTFPKLILAPGNEGEDAILLASILFLNKLKEETNVICNQKNQLVVSPEIMETAQHKVLKELRSHSIRRRDESPDSSSASDSSSND
ncbi:hypothetical protein BLNAU_53 [Blattamonas nauphoetae]|uniref:Uncharacterized protein n=1 Tax=Blattamonas nauphoetae TaxID=2049346 RepID=A0ABQ9YLW6_9EUKA|nr:hypothetical protein BLNAU_53 [Blattamonas nauphoetae]